MEEGQPESAIDIRCPEGRLHFKVINGNVIEVKCQHRNADGPDFVVLHRYSFPELELLETLRFKDPVIRGHGARSLSKGSSANGRIPG